MIRTAFIPLLLTPLAAQAAPQCSAAVALAAPTPPPAEAPITAAQGGLVVSARPFTTTEIAASPALARLASHGASLTDLGSTHGLQAVFAKNGQRFQVFYVAPGRAADQRRDRRCCFLLHLQVAVIAMNSVLGILAASLLALMMLPRLTGMQQNGLSQTQMAATGQQFRALMDGAQAYIQAHSDVVQSSIPVGSTGSISIATLISDNRLQANFSAVNAFGQTWQVQVRQTSAGVLQTVITSSGGTAMTGTQAANIASIAGNRGGFVPTDGLYGSASSQTARGAWGGWTLPMTNYSNPGPGHLAGLLAFQNGQLSNNYLYRVSVPNHPELNQMQTGLDMGTNSISNANDVQANTGTFASGNPNGRPGAVQIGSGYVYGDSSNLAVRMSGSFYVQKINGGAADINAANGIYSGQLGTNGYSATSGYPSGLTGGVHTQDVYAEGQLATGKDGNGNALTSFTNNGDGKVGRNLTVAGTTESKGDVISDTQVRLAAIASSGAACSNVGAIAANISGSGQTMSCFGGIWMPIGATAHWSQWSLPANYQGTYAIPGVHAFCALNDSFEINENDAQGNNGVPSASRVYANGQDSYGRTYWVMSRGAGSPYGTGASCLDY